MRRAATACQAQPSMLGWVRMGRAYGVAWRWGVLGLVLAGCGGRSVATVSLPGGADVSLGAGSPLEPAAYCEAVARVLCRAELPCCAERGFSGSEASCVADRRAESVHIEGQEPFGFDCSPEQPAPDGYDAAQAGACVTELTRS